MWSWQKKKKIHIQTCFLALLKMYIKLYFLLYYTGPVPSIISNTADMNIYLTYM